MSKTETGLLEIICGPMFSGKTEELIKRLRRATIAKQNVQVFKPVQDNRYHNTNIVSHSKYQTTAMAVRNANAIIQFTTPDTKVIGIDEIQFFDDAIISVCDRLVNEGKRIICSGLDMDYKGEPFGITKELLAKADLIMKCSAICMKCGKSATRTQKLKSGGERIEVGGEELYEARCRGCHEIY